MKTQKFQTKFLFGFHRVNQIALVSVSAKVGPKKPSHFYIVSKSSLDETISKTVLPHFTNDPIA